MLLWYNLTTISIAFISNASKEKKIQVEFGENIYQYRTERGLSQGALAEALEVSRQSVSKWENNSATPDLDKLIKMSKLFNISLDELVFGVSEKKETLCAPEKPSDFFHSINPRIFIGSSLLLFGMVFFLLSIFWGNQLRLGEEFGELLSLSIVLISIALISTYNQWTLATCAVIYFLYSVVCVGILDVTSMTNYIFMFFMGLVILVWFIVWGLHANKEKSFPDMSDK